MNKLISPFLIYSIFFVLPLTDVFWLFNRLPGAIYFIYLMALASSIALYIHSYHKKKHIYNIWYYLIITCLSIILILSFIFNNWTFHGFQYLLWFLWIFNVYGLFVKFLFDNTQIPLNGNNIFINVILLHSIIALIDWASVNNLIDWYNLNDILQRGENHFDSLGLGFIRLRGSVEEGAHYAFFLNIFFPISIVLSNYSLTKKMMITGVIFISYFLSAALSAWIFEIIGLTLAIACVSYNDYKAMFKWVIFLFFGICLLSFFGAFNSDLFNRLSDPNDVSKTQRLAIYSDAFISIKNQNLLQLFFGYGPASFVDKFETNPVSLYLLFFHDYGLLSIFLILGLFIGLVMCIVNSNLLNRIKLAILASMLASFLQYSVTSNIWHPWLWFMMAFSLYIIRYAKY